MLNRRHLPRLQKVHILGLCVEATEALYPEVAKQRRLIKQTQADPLALLEHLSGLLRSTTGLCLALTQFQVFIVECKVYIVVAMEASGISKVSEGLLVESTSIYTEGLPLELLSSAHLSLVRPHTYIDSEVAPPPSPSQGIARGLGKGPSRSFFMRNLLQQRNKRPATGTTGSDETIFVEKPSKEASGDQLLTVVYLESLLTHYLTTLPCIVFAAGQHIDLPLPKELAFLLASQQSASDLSSIAQNPLLNSDSISQNSTTLYVGQECTQQSLSCNHNLKSASHHHRLTHSDEPSSSSSSIRIFVIETSHSLPGVIAPGKTSVNFALDSVGFFQHVEISPMADTVPNSYNFDFFNDYIDPFLSKHPFKLYAEGDIFSYHGVEFKLTRTLPKYRHRIRPPDDQAIYWKPFSGVCPVSKRSPIIICETIKTAQLREEMKRHNDAFLTRLISRRNGIISQSISDLTNVTRGLPIRPHWLDLLPSEVVDEVRLLPSRLQPFALLQAISDMAPQDLVRILGIIGPGYEETPQQEMRDQVAIKVLGEFATVFDGGFETQNTDEKDALCIVCLSSLEHGDSVLELPCSHVFHVACVEEWLKRSSNCPVCKSDLKELVAKNKKK